MMVRAFSGLFRCASWRRRWTCSSRPTASPAARSARGSAPPVPPRLRCSIHRCVAVAAGHYRALALPVDVLVPVPLHPARERRRGHNQARLLAAEMAPRLGLPMVEGLARLRNTPAQVGLSRAQRLVNVRGAFCATDAAVTDKCVLLIDDVCTTGATLGACADALRRAGARSVWALTLARAVDTSPRAHNP